MQFFIWCIYDRLHNQTQSVLKFCLPPAIAQLSVALYYSASQYTRECKSRNLFLLQKRLFNLHFSTLDWAYLPNDNTTIRGPCVARKNCLSQCFVGLRSRQKKTKRRVILFWRVFFILSCEVWLCRWGAGFINVEFCLMILLVLSLRQYTEICPLHASPNWVRLTRKTLSRTSKLGQNVFELFEKIIWQWVKIINARKFIGVKMTQSVNGGSRNNWIIFFALYQLIRWLRLIYLPIYICILCFSYVVWPYVRRTSKQ